MVERAARAVLETFLASDLAVRLREVELLGREMPMLLRDDAGVTWRGSIDLLYRRDGSVVVADYKTDEDETGAAERYAPQMQIYRDAVQRALGLEDPPRAELWMLRSGRVIPLERADPSPPAPLETGQPRLF